jgi:uncharacterized phage-like protein YoqJ
MTENKYPDLTLRLPNSRMILHGPVFLGDERILAITGHRPDKLDRDYTYTSPLFQKIRRALHLYIDIYQPDLMITGMALGIDTVFAQIAIERQIPFIAAIPFEHQDVKWPKLSRSLYLEILKKAVFIVNVTGQIGYCSTHMQTRNEWMVDHCTKLVGVWDGSAGGTHNCIHYAKTVMKENDITIINPQLL